MAVLVDDLAQKRMTRDRVRSDLSAEVFDDLTAVETLWRGIETDPGVLATPYQRFDWVSAFLEGSFGVASADEV